MQQAIDSLISEQSMNDVKEFNEILNQIIPKMERLEELYKKLFSFDKED